MSAMNTVTRNDLRTIRESKIEEIIHTEYQRIHDEIIVSNLKCNTNCTITVLYRNNEILTGIWSKLRATFVDLHIYVGNRGNAGSEIVLKWD